MAILPKAIYTFNSVPIKIPMTFITEIEKPTSTFIWKHKKLNSQVNTQQKEQCCRYHNTWLQTISQSNSNKNTWYWHKNRHEDQWTRIEDPDTNPHNCTHLIFDKGAKITWWRIDSLFYKCFREKWLSACRKLKLDPCLSPCTSINSNWIEDLNIRPKTLKLVQERSGNTLEATGIGKDFRNRTREAQQLRERMEKLNYMKLKRFCTTKEMVST
jgi:hypothetical protein